MCSCDALCIYAMQITHGMIYKIIMSTGRIKITEQVQLYLALLVEFYHVLLIIASHFPSRSLSYIPGGQLGVCLALPYLLVNVACMPVILCRLFALHVIL